MRTGTRKLRPYLWHLYSIHTLNLTYSTSIKRSSSENEVNTELINTEKSRKVYLPVRLLAFTLTATNWNQKGNQQEYSSAAALEIAHDSHDCSVLPWKFALIFSWFFVHCRLLNFLLHVSVSLKASYVYFANNTTVL